MSKSDLRAEGAIDILRAGLAHWLFSGFCRISPKYWDTFLHMAIFCKSIVPTVDSAYGDTEH